MEMLRIDFWDVYAWSALDTSYNKWILSEKKTYTIFVFAKIHVRIYTGNINKESWTGLYVFMVCIF